MNIYEILTVKFSCINFLFLIYIIYNKMIKKLRTIIINIYKFQN